MEMLYVALTPTDQQETIMLELSEEEEEDVGSPATVSHDERIIFIMS
jgi:hypothetical protein